MQDPSDDPMLTTHDMPDDMAVDPSQSEEPVFYVDTEVQQRLMLRAVMPILQLRSHESDPSDRVQLAFDKMHIAVAERVSRIMQSDLNDEAVDRGPGREG